MANDKTIFLKRIPPRITIVMNHVIYPGVNKIDFETADKRKSFLGCAAMRANIKAGAIVVLDESDIKESEIVNTKFVYSLPEKDNSDLVHVLEEKKAKKDKE